MTGKVFNDRTGQITTRVDTAEDIAQRDADYAADVTDLEYRRSLANERSDIEALGSTEELLEQLADVVMHIASRSNYLQDAELRSAIGKFQAIKDRKAQGRAEHGE